MSAAPIGGSAALLMGARPIGRGQRFARRLGAALMVVGLLPGAAPIGALDIGIDRVRSAKGVLRICLTADPKNFPGCVDDAHATTRSIPAGEHETRFEGLPHGDYAVAVIHDENRNSKLDTFMGIPREGFGFSRNPVISFGPPKFKSAEFALDGDSETQRINMRYLL